MAHSKRARILKLMVEEQDFLDEIKNLLPKEDISEIGRFIEFCKSSSKRFTLFHLNTLICKKGLSAA